MKKYCFRVLVLLILFFSNLNDASAATMISPDPWLISSMQVGPVTIAGSEKQLIEKLASDARSERRPGAEGQGSYPVTILYPDSNREIQVWWSDETRTRPGSIRITKPDSPWHTARGIRIGMTLAELVKLNEGPIGFYGFGWDYGGWVFRQAPILTADGLSLSLRLRPAGSDFPEGFNGDKPLSSDNPELPLDRVIISVLILDFKSDSIPAR